MGRGRAKAKQTKVARELKYMTPNTDLTALERELRNSKSSGQHNAYEPGQDDENSEYEDRWADAPDEGR